MSAVPAVPERDLLLEFLERQRRKVRNAADGLDEDGARWTPDDRLHLIEETAQHAGHAEATREMLDGTTA